VRVLLAGAAGVMGRQLAPRLVAAGHDVVGMTRNPAKRDAVIALGATPVIAAPTGCGPRAPTTCCRRDVRWGSSAFWGACAVSGGRCRRSPPASCVAAPTAVHASPTSADSSSRETVGSTTGREGLRDWLLSSGFRARGNLIANQRSDARRSRVAREGRAQRAAPAAPLRAWSSAATETRRCTTRHRGVDDRSRVPQPPRNPGAGARSPDPRKQHKSRFSGWDRRCWS